MLLNTNLTRLLALAALISLLLAGLSQAQKAAGPEAASFKGFQVSFKMDPRLTQGMYMGERWVSPPTYTRVQEGKKPLTVEARAEGFDAEGNPVKVSPTWKPDKTDMVQVSPAQGGEVKLTILKEGQSNLTVTYEGVSRQLSIKAVYQDNAMQVKISQ